MKSKLPETTELIRNNQVRTNLRVEPMTKSIQRQQLNGKNGSGDANEEDVASERGFRKGQESYKDRHGTMWWHVA